MTEEQTVDPVLIQAADELAARIAMIILLAKTMSDEEGKTLMEGVIKALERYAQVRKASLSGTVEETLDLPTGAPIQ